MTSLKIEDLKKIAELSLQQDYNNGEITAVRLVKAYHNSYAENTEGGITALSLSNSSLETLVIGEEAKALEYLYLSENELLKTIVFEIALPHLTHIYIDGCNLEELVIPTGFTALQQIYVQKQKNKLKSLVFQGVCPVLQLLDASENDLLSLRFPYVFEFLDYLYLKGSENIDYLPKEIYADKTNCADSVKAYLRASFQSGSILNREAKCIFFGNGRAGKTTLSHQLRKNEFDKSIQYTHGILIEEWTISQNEFPSELKGKINNEIEVLNRSSAKVIDPPLSIQLNVWDFGGQEYFHATHRLFLNSNVLYVLVWEQDTDKQNEERGDYPRDYWQNNINHYAPKNVTLIVQNKERGQAVTDYQNKLYKVTTRKDANNDSIREYELDVKRLKEGILQQLSSLEYLGKPIPVLYDDIRKELRKEKSRNPYLSFADYKLLCQRMDKTEGQIMQNENDIEQLTRFLHDTGSLICYRYDADKKTDKLDDFVFIDPQWVTKTIYEILDETTLKGKGQFDKAHVSKVLTENKNIIQEASVWLNLMTEFQLIFTKHDTVDQFITPQYLPNQCQELVGKAWTNLKDELPHKLVLRYPDFLPKSVISRFICLNGNFAKDYYWKYGIVVHQDGEKALVYCDYNKKEISLQTVAPLSDLAVKLFGILRGIDKTDKLEVNVPSVEGFVNFNKLKERFEKGKEDVDWNGKEFEIEHFKPLFGRKEGMPFGEKEPVNQKAKTNSEMNEIQAQVRALIAQAKTLKAIELIESWANQQKAKELQDTIALIKADWTKLKRDENMGLVTNPNYAPLNYRLLNIDFSVETVVEIQERSNDRQSEMQERSNNQGETPSNKATRGIGFDEKEKCEIDNSQPVEVPMVKGARLFIPFTEITSPIKILFLAATPTNQAQLNTGLESRFEDLIRTYDDERRFMVIQKHGVSPENFHNEIISERPSIVHYGGHGETEGIVLQGKNLQTDVLTRILKLSKKTQCVVLNACNSLAIAKAAAEHVPYVIGTQDKIGDNTAIAFARGFYMGIISDMTVEEAFENGLVFIEREGLSDADVLVLVKGIPSNTEGVK